MRPKLINKALAILGVLLIGWLVFHVVGDHHGHEKSDCQVCQVAALFLIIIPAGVYICTRLLGYISLSEDFSDSSTFAAFRGRGPPHTAIF